MMLYLSKPLAPMAFKAGLASKFAVNAVASSTLPCLPHSYPRFDELSPWYQREQKGFYVKYQSCGPQLSSPSGLQAISGIFFNCLPPSGSSKPPPSSNFSLQLFPPKKQPSSRKIEATYTKDVLHRLRSTSIMDTNKVLSHRHTLLQLPSFRARMLRSRDLHSSCIQLGKYKSKFGKGCQPTKEICKSKGDVCSDTESCKNKDAECYPEKVKCEPQKVVKEEAGDEKVCPKSCVRGGKCIIAPTKKPAKMVYGSTECPPQKLITPRTCPQQSSNEYANDEPVCTEKAAAKKLRKDVCVPPPLPGPPTDPVPLCRCPPPPKLHPGPCPCPAFKDDLKIKQSPPCPVEDKYPCCFPTYYCPPKKPCVRKLPCDQMKKKK